MPIVHLMTLREVALVLACLLCAGHTSTDPELLSTPPGEHLFAGVAGSLPPLSLRAIGELAILLLSMRPISSFQLASGALSRRASSKRMDTRSISPTGHPARVGRGTWLSATMPLRADQFHNTAEFWRKIMGTKMPVPQLLSAPHTYTSVPQFVPMPPLVASESAMMKAAFEGAESANVAAGIRDVEDRILSDVLRNATEVAADVGHGLLLPAAYARRIPKSDDQVLRFILSFLEKEGLGNVTAFVNGGYVRDLLMGIRPYDLDLSLDLRVLSGYTRVDAILFKLPEFAKKYPRYGIIEVKLGMIFSDEAKSKNLDAFKAFFINDQGSSIEVDIMPTGGEEQYEMGSRVPVRDHRGSPEEDSLRRDLSVGAMLLRIDKGSSVHDVDGRERLSYRLFDFYGGVEDLRNRVLRAPFPKDKGLDEVSKMVLRTDVERALAKSLHLRNRPEAEAVQILWWAKALMDDPLRACRAVRFAVTLPNFTLHEAFWPAMPFAMKELSVAVKGSRKFREFIKIAEFGHQPTVDFFELVFARKFGPEDTLDVKDSGLDSNLTLAPALFSAPVRITNDAYQEPPRSGLWTVQDFDLDKFRELARALAPVAGSSLGANETFGLFLLAAIAACRGLEGLLEEHFTLAARSLSGTQDMMKAGTSTARIAAELVGQPRAPTAVEEAFAGATGTSVEDLRLHADLWEHFICSKPEFRWSAQRRNFTMRLAWYKMLEQPQGNLAAATELQDRLAAATEVITHDRPRISGKIFMILKVQKNFRAPMLAMLEVVTRSLRYDAPLETEEDLEALFTIHPRLREAVRGLQDIPQERKESALA